MAAQPAKQEEEKKEEVGDLASYWKKLSESEAKSLLKKHLTPEVYGKLKDAKTKSGYDLLSCIRSGVDNLDSGVGVYASDPEVYTEFGALFDAIIVDYHKIKTLDGFKQPVQNFQFDDAFQGDLDPEGKFVISTRVRVARNIAGYPLRGGMTKEQTLELEKKVSDILQSFEDEDLKGKYYPLAKMTEEERKQLVDDHFLFKKGDRFLESAGINNFWPEGRGIFHNANKTFLVWINEEDQLRIISMEQGANIKSVFGRLQKAVKAINEKLQFAFHEKFGYLTACPTNLGCGERASVHIKVPLLSSKNKKLFDEIAVRHNLQIRGIHGEHSESEGGIYDVSNKRRLGISEWDGVKDLINGVNDLIKEEKALQEAQK
jgi:protein-arginine kinase